MAQTIALQRGTTTLTANGTDSVTLFTQSGGTATRVILNQLGASLSNVPNNAYMTLIHQVSGGQTFVLGILKYGSSGARSFQFAPGASSANPFAAIPMLTSTSNSGGRAPTPIIHSDGSDGVANIAPNIVSVTWPTGAAEDRYGMLCSNFYMGPSDSLRIRCKADLGEGYPTATISYSFTTITES
jgi:hypothetical protein